MAKFLFFANSATDGAAIRVDRITDVEITGASGSAKVSVNFDGPASIDGSILLDTDNSVTAAKEIARICAQKDSRFITIADDVNSIYIDGVTACGTIAHSA
jgi:hypothetical protein|tara:strand:- start:61 stop:363 length:303 start_codon:yes stop_codon:yes gene_type:complete